LEKTIDIICAGEVLIDFIGHQMNSSINKTKDYHRLLGGSPTNVAVNAVRLGLKSVLVAACGDDGLGDYIIRKLKSNNVNTSHIRKLATHRTSVIFVSKSTSTPDFIAYRESDCQIQSNQIPEELLKSAKIFHTSCFALSKNPARTTIVESAKRAKALGLQTSIDINFSEKIWPDRKEANQILREYLATNPLVKVSEDDCYRFFDEIKSEDYIFNYFHGLGADTICLTKGKDGVVLSNVALGIFCQEAVQITDIKDATGAGDAFWAGFLYAQLHNKNFDEALTIAQKLAALKLQNVGKLPEGIAIQEYLNTK
jgi:fructokinase